MEAIRTLQYSLPQAVEPHIQMIQPTTRFGQFNPQRSQAFRVGGAKGPATLMGSSRLAAGTQDTAVDSNCKTSITPDCLRALYKVGNYTAKPGSGNKLGIAGYLEEYAKYNDLEQFLTTYAPQQDPAKNNFTHTLINGGKDTQDDTVNDDVEANLDVQYAMSMAYLTPTTYFSTGGRGPLIPDLINPTPMEAPTSPTSSSFTTFLRYPTTSYPPR